MTVAAPAVGVRGNNSVGATTLVMGYPAGIYPGLLLVLHAAGGGTFTAPAAPWVTVWNEVTLACRGIMAYKVADGSETGNFTLASASGKSSGVLLGFPGVDPDRPAAAAATTVSNATGTTTVVLPSQTVDMGGVMLVYGCTLNSSALSVSSGTGTEDEDYFAEFAASTGKSGGIYHELLNQAGGATGTRTITGSASSINAGAMLALRPAAPVPAVASVYGGTV